jgi:hypothetical protein
MMRVAGMDGCGGGQGRGWAWIFYHPAVFSHFLRVLSARVGNEANHATRCMMPAKNTTMIVAIQAGTNNHPFWNSLKKLVSLLMGNIFVSWLGLRE